MSNYSHTSTLPVEHDGSETMDWVNWTGLIRKPPKELTRSPVIRPLWGISKGRPA